MWVKLTECWRSADARLACSMHLLQKVCMDWGRWSHHRRHSQNTSTFKAPDCASNTLFALTSKPSLKVLWLCCPFWLISGLSEKPAERKNCLEHHHHPWKRKVLGSIPRNTCHLWWIAVCQCCAGDGGYGTSADASCRAGAAGSCCCWCDCAASRGCWSCKSCC